MSATALGTLPYLEQPPLPNPLADLTAPPAVNGTSPAAWTPSTWRLGQPVTPQSADLSNLPMPTAAQIEQQRQLINQRLKQYGYQPQTLSDQQVLATMSNLPQGPVRWPDWVTQYQQTHPEQFNPGAPRLGVDIPYTSTYEPYNLATPALNTAVPTKVGAMYAIPREALIARYGEDAVTAAEQGLYGSGQDSDLLMRIRSGQADPEEVKRANPKPVDSQALFDAKARQFWALKAQMDKTAPSFYHVGAGGQAYPVPPPAGFQSQPPGAPGAPSPSGAPGPAGVPGTAGAPSPPQARPLTYSTAAFAPPAPSAPLATPNPLNNYRFADYRDEQHIDPEHMLHWDLPLSRQSPYVQQRLPFSPDSTGRDIHTQLAGDGGFVTASARLASLGIPGVRYYDQDSRGAAQAADQLQGQIARMRAGGASDAAIARAQQMLDQVRARISHNYVVYDDSTLNIIRRHGLPALIAGGADALYNHRQGPGVEV